MKKLLIIALMASLASCSKKASNNAVAPDYQTILQSKTWVCDSVYDIQGNNKTVTYVQTPVFLTIDYSTITYTVKSNDDPSLTKNYKIAGDTIFYWTPPNEMDPSQYSIIKKLTSDFYQQSEKDGGDETQYFFHGR